MGLCKAPKTENESLTPLILFKRFRPKSSKMTLQNAEIFIKQKGI